MAEKEPDPEDAQEADKENEGRDSVSWPGPRTVIVPRAENGFGFTLRHFIVYPPESAVPDELQEDELEDVADVDGRQRKRSRMSELEPMDTIFVKQVKEEGPAQHAGLHTGDRIVSVNGETVTGKSYAQVIALIQSSGSSLKLLVVPKDEDILQMAYQNSAYNQGQLPYRGHASEIPRPPSVSAQPSLRGPALRPKPETRPQGKPPMGPRYKSELRMVPEDESSRLRYSDPVSGPPFLDSVLGRRRTSTGSLGSVSSGTSSSSTREHVIMPLAELAPSRLPKVEDLGSPGDDPSGTFNPPAPKRISSRNIVLSHFQQLENRSGSLDSISRSSDSSNSRRSVESDPPMSRRSQEYGIPLHVRRSQENVRLSNENLASARLSGEPLRASAESISQLRHSRENLRHSSDDLLHQGLQSEERLGLSKSSTTSRLPSTTTHRPTIYTRSHTTSTLVNPPSSYSSPTFLRSHAQQQEAAQATCNRAIRPSSSAQTQVTFSSPQHQAQGMGRSTSYSDHTYSRPNSWSNPSTGYGQHQGKSDHNQDGDLQYGATFKFTFQDGSDKGDPTRFVDVTQVGPGPGTNITFSSGRIGGSDQQINMVTERLRKFESADSCDSLSSAGSGRHSGPLSPRETRSLPHSYKGVPTMGIDSVASRVSQFENMSDHENHSGDEKVWVRKISTESAPDCQRFTSREDHWRREMSPTSLSERNLAQTLPPPEINKVPCTPPATINIYFKGETGQTPSATLQPSPERVLGSHSRQYSDRSYSDLGTLDGRDRSPLGSRDLQMSPPSSRRSHKSALRQPSYLTAIHSPHNKTAPPSFLDSSSGSERDGLTSECSQDSSQDSSTPGRALVSALNTMMAVMTPEGVPPSGSTTSLDLSPLPTPTPLVATSASDLTTTPVSSSTVTLRQHSSTDDREAKLVRRTSYLMATGKDRPQLCAMPMETSKSDSHLQLQVTSPLPVSQTETQPVESKPITSNRPGVKKVGLKLDLSKIPEEPPPPPSSPPPAEDEEVKAEQQEEASQDAEAEKATQQQQQLLPPRLMEPDVQTTPTKTSNIRKLKAFFGEKRTTGPPTPRIMEATSDHRRVFDMPASVGDIIREGTLNCKIAVTDGKRASDRSWRPMWVMLRKKYLYLFKDKNAASTSPTISDEQPIPIKSSIVDIAYDYTKKKHVFRLTTFNECEYLFQAEERETMLDWIRLIQMNNNLEEEITATQESQVTCSATDIMEKKSLQVEKSGKGSPQAVHKAPKKVSTKSLRSKSPAAHSPGVKQKKQTFEKVVDHTDSPRPKDKEVKEYTRTWKSKFMFKRGGSSSSVPAELNGTFNVPLDCCPRSVANECIPMVVEVCTSIVEERGLENQGIYRVPGNTGAVNALQEELNKLQDGEMIDTSNDIWLDINVVSSLLKSFFRKLPEALITDELYDNVIAANRVENPEKRMLRLKQLLHRLPDHNFETFRFIAQHLSRVAAMGHVNKMDARNLAIVFGPTLVRTTDESMVTMVKDMSDQCRIVESIILHHNWFFLSWEEDHEVPVDEEMADAMPVSGMNQELLNKAECLEVGERGRDLSAKDLISSVISAANRKIKKKDKKSSESGSIDVDLPSDSGYNERNIDREIELRRVKESITSQTVTKTGSKGNVTTTSTKEGQQVMVSVRDGSDNTASATRDIFAAKRAFMNSRTDSETSATTTSSSGSSNDSWGNIKLTKYPAIKVPTWNSPVTENAKPTMHRRYSEDSNERRGDDEVVQGGRRGGSFTPQVAKHLRSLEREKLALQQHKELKRQEHERRAVDKRRIEQELQKTRHELETEEDSLDDLLTKRMGSLRLGDNTSVTSDYSTTSSSNVTFEPKIPTSLQSNLSDYSSSASPTSLNLDRSPVLRSGNLFDEPDSLYSPTQGGKYFVMSAGNRKSRDDTELYRTPGLRSPPGFDPWKVAGRGTLTRKKRSSGSEDGGEEDLNPPFSRSNSFQRSASLDSLRDLYKDHSFLSDDSDEFVDSITATLDQKMRIFGESRKSGVGGSISPQAEKRKPDVSSRLGGLGDMHKNYSEGSLTDSSFRDPSLHRVQRSDPKIDSTFQQAESSWGRFHKTGATASFPSGRRREDGAEDENDRTRRDLKPHSGRSAENRPITKSEKTDVNMSRKEQDPFASDYTRAIRKSTEKLYGSREHLLGSHEHLVDTGNSTTNRPENTKVLKRQKKAPSVSPPLPRHASKDKTVRRRHTVGCTEDSEHFRALMILNQPCRSDDRLSTWPVVHDSCPGDSRTMMGWMEDQERFHGVRNSPTPHHGRPQSPTSEYPYTQNTDGCQQLGPRLPPEGRSSAVANKSSLPGPGSEKSSPVHNGTSQRPHTFTFESSI